MLKCCLSKGKQAAWEDENLKPGCQAALHSVQQSNLHKESPAQLCDSQGVDVLLASVKAAPNSAWQHFYSGYISSGPFCRQFLFAGLVPWALTAHRVCLVCSTLPEDLFLHAVTMCTCFLEHTCGIFVFLDLYMGTLLTALI